MASFNPYKSLRDIRSKAEAIKGYTRGCENGKSVVLDGFNIVKGLICREYNDIAKFSISIGTSKSSQNFLMRFSILGLKFGRWSLTIKSLTTSLTHLFLKGTLIGLKRYSDLLRYFPYTLYS